MMVNHTRKIEVVIVSDTSRQRKKADTTNSLQSKEKPFKGIQRLKIKLLITSLYLTIHEKRRGVYGRSYNQKQL